MNKIYLVEGNVYREHYMEETERFWDSRIVMATSSQEAKEKYESWWKKETVEYSTYYYAIADCVKEAIE